MSLIRQVLLDSPAGYWPFNGSIADLSGNARNASLVGTAGYEADFLFGQRVRAPSATNYISVSSVTEFKFDGSAITVEAWAKTPTVGAYTYVAAKTPLDNGTHDWILYFNRNSGGPAMWLSQDGSGSQYKLAASAIGSPAADIWYHIVGTYDGTTIAVYINGVLQTSNSSATGSASTGTTEVVRWGDYGVEVNDMSLAHCAIYDAALSATRISAHYQAGRRGGSVFG